MAIMKSDRPVTTYVYWYSFPLYVSSFSIHWHSQEYRHYLGPCWCLLLWSYPSLVVVWSSRVDPYFSFIIMESPSKMKSWTRQRTRGLSTRVDSSCSLYERGMVCLMGADQDYVLQGLLFLDQRYTLQVRNRSREGMLSTYLDHGRAWNQNCLFDHSWQ